MWKTAENGWPCASAADQPVRRSATGFIRVTRPRRSVAMTPSPMLWSVVARLCSLARSSSSASLRSVRSCVTFAKPAILAAPVADRRDDDVRPEARAVFAHAPAFVGVAPLRARLCEDARGLRVALLGRVEDRERLAHDLLLGPTLQRAGSCVPRGDATVAVEHEDRVLLHRFDEPLEAIVLANGHVPVGDDRDAGVDERAHRVDRVDEPLDVVGMIARERRLHDALDRARDRHPGGERNAPARVGRRLHLEVLDVRGPVAGLERALQASATLHLASVGDLARRRRDHCAEHGIAHRHLHGGRAHALVLRFVSRPEVGEAGMLRRERGERHRAHYTRLDSPRARSSRSADRAPTEPNCHERHIRRGV